MTTLIGKHFSKLTMAAPPTSGPTDDDYIRSLNYDDLEKRFNVRKYYPRFIHNHDFSTPQIKEMIADKPIYAKASGSGCRTRKKVMTEIDMETGQMKIVDDSDSKTLHRQERKADKDRRREERLEQRAVHKEERRKHKEERKKLREQHRAERHGALDSRRATLSEETAEPYVNPAIKPPTMAHHRSNDILFKNPFGAPLDLDQATLVVTQQKPMDGTRLRQNSIQPIDSYSRKSSISGKLKDMMFARRHHDKNDTKLARTVSYDQTRSTMTSARGARTDVLRNKDKNGRRMSDRIGTYILLTTRY